MDGKKYVTKAYPSYTGFPAQQGSNDHMPQNPVNLHMVDTKTINKVLVPAVVNTYQFGSPTKFELLNEYVYGPDMSRSSNYAPTSNYEVNNKPNYGITYGNSDKRIFTSPLPGYSSEESTYGPGLKGASHVRTKEFVGPNSYQSLKTAHRRGTQSEVLGYFKESDYYLPRLDPSQRGVLSDLTNRERPLEIQSHYSRPSIVAKPNNSNYTFTNTKGNY